MYETVGFHHRGTETQSHRIFTAKTQSAQRHRTEKPQITQMNADFIAHRTSQTQRLEDTKDSQRHRTGVSRPIGRAATARSRGIEARWTDHHVQARVDRIHLRLGSCLRHAQPASVVWTTPKSSPTVTLSEGIRRVSRRVPRGLGGHCFLRFHSLRMTVCARVYPAPQNQPIRCSAGVPPAPHASTPLSKR